MTNCSHEFGRQLGPSETIAMALSILTMCMDDLSINSLAKIEDRRSGLFEGTTGVAPYLSMPEGK